MENLDRLSIIHLTSGDIFKQEDFCFHNSKPHNPFLSPVGARMNDSLGQTAKSPWQQIEYMHLKFHVIRSVKTILEHRHCKDEVVFTHFVSISEVHLEG